MRNPLSGAKYANVAATLALVTALGGTSYAAATIGTSDIQKSAVTAPKIKNGAVKVNKIRTGAVNSTKVKDNSLTGADVQDMAMVPLKLDNGWKKASALDPRVGVDTSGVVHMRGGISNPGAYNAVITTLDPAFRPADVVFVNTNLANFASGARLIIFPTGVVQLQAPPAAEADAKGFTSLDVSFAR